MSRLIAGAVGIVLSLAFTVCSLTAPAVAFPLAVPFAILVLSLLTSHLRPHRRRRPHA